MQGEGSIPRRTAARDTSRNLVALVTSVLEDGQAEDIVDIDLAGKTSIADRMVIASAGSQRQVSALADRLVRALREAGYKTYGIEGLAQGEWVLLDAGDIIVHIFRPEMRELYNLEKMWAVALPEPMEARA